MNRKPWPIIILALLQLFAPIVNAFINSWLLHIPLNVYFKQFVLHKSVLSLIVLFVIPIACAVFIYICKLWSLIGFITLEVFLVAWNILQRTADPNHYSLLTVSTFNTVNLVLVLYFLIPAVRQVYTNPRIRWWESKPRYLKEHKVSLIYDGQQIEATTINISEGGAFISTSHLLQAHKTVSFLLKDGRHEFSISAEILHTSPQNNLAGLKFHTKKSKVIKRVKKYISHLKESGTPERSPIEPWQTSFLAWIKAFNHPQKALLPQVPQEIRDLIKKEA